MVAEKLNRGIFRGRLSGKCSMESKSAQVMGGWWWWRFTVLVVLMLLRVAHLDLRDVAVDRRVEVYLFFAVSNALET